MPLFKRREEYLRGPAMPLMNSGNWNPDLHPRNELGEFIYTDGGLHGRPPKGAGDKTGAGIDKWKIEAVKTYVSHAALILDQIKTKTGAYPSELPTDLIGEPPSLLRDYGDYTATPESFYFEYSVEPAGWAGGEGALKFESSRREWVEDR